MNNNSNLELNLAVNLGLAVNRYSEPEDWAKLCAECGVHRVQFSADLLNPSLPDHIVDEYVCRIIEACAEYQIQVTSSFTGAFTRLNHLAHPNEKVQQFWIEWFKRFAEINVRLGSKVIGSHFGILTKYEDSNPDLRQHRIEANIKNWHKVADYARSIGIECILWEPMSISRELGETIERCRLLHEQVNRDAPLPFKICLDVDHGDISSPDPRDTDPYAWLAEFGKEAPIIHLKQSSADKGGHWPFTPEYNKNGKIKPERVVSELKKCGSEKNELVLELSFREREPADSSVPYALSKSVEYWSDFLK